jgi:hypothetical protein
VTLCNVVRPNLWSSEETDMPVTQDKLTTVQEYFSVLYLYPVSTYQMAILG